MKYFIGNWKMFGIPSSINIINKMNAFIKKDKYKNSYKVVVTPPFTLIEKFSKNIKGGKVGKWKYYYESGNLRQTSSYSRNGQRSGKWIKYEENGDIIEVIEYK